MAARAPSQIQPAWNVPDPNNFIPGYAGIAPLKKGIKALGGVGQTAKDIGTGLQIISDPIRLGEFLVGILLIGVGVNAMLKNTPVGSAVNTAASVANPSRFAKVVK